MNLIPMPKQVQTADGRVAVTDVYCSRVEGVLPPFVTALLYETFPSEGTCPLTVECGADDMSEAYMIVIDASGIRITADGYRGVFYALKTLGQWEENGTYAYGSIKDHPDFSYRGWYQDVSRGRIPTLATLKRLVDRLSALKMNSLQLYVEHTHAFACYAGIADTLGYYTDEDILELDRYCRERCVELVPSLSCFGHLYALLQSPTHRHLCELEEYKPTRHHWHERLMHHTIDPSDERSVALIGNMIAQYAPLFSSDKFNICCDETFDLCKGKNAGREVGDVYAHFVLQLIACLRQHGKTPMMWSDIVLKHPETMQVLPEDVLYLNWWYDANPHGLHAEVLEQAQRHQIVCPSVNSHKRLVEKLVYSVPNIRGVVKEGLAHGAMGVLNTNWGDYGHICIDDNVTYGLAYGAAKSWNAQSDDKAVETAILKTQYRTDSEEVLSVIHTLNQCDEIPFEREGYEMALWELTVQVYDDELSPAVDVEYRKEVLRGTPLTEKRQDALLCAERVKSLLEHQNLDPSIGEALLLAAKGTACILGMLCAYAHGEAVDEALKAETRDWLSSYKARWLADNQLGEWEAIETFIERMLTKHA